MDKLKAAALVIALALVSCLFLHSFRKPQPALQQVLVIEYGESGNTIVEYSTWRVVSAIRLELYATISYQGYLQGWDCSGTLEWKVRYYGGGDIVTITMPLSKSPNAPAVPPNGQRFVISSATLQAYDLENILSSYLPPPYYYGYYYLLEIHVRVVSFTLTMNFIDGAKSASSGNLPSSTWAFCWM